ncbi:Uncharacterized protein conserved in bacteria [Legionella spiritensis]|nr:Uncharacterized protein conserved in bacteria [Legionella spiritensis]
MFSSRSTDIFEETVLNKENFFSRKLKFFQEMQLSEYKEEILSGRLRIKGVSCMNRLRWMAIALCAGGLSSCAMNNSMPGYSGYTSYSYEDVDYIPQAYYDGNFGYEGYQQQYQSGRQVTVPNSYHVGAYHSPIKSKDQDRNWVSGQNPGGYTIEIANGKASQVAKKLMGAPKNNHTAQIKYQRNGGSYYKGLYGSFNSYEEAQKALNALPPDIKQGSGIRNWGNVQNSMNSY